MMKLRRIGHHGKRKGSPEAVQSQRGVVVVMVRERKESHGKSSVMTSWGLLPLLENRVTQKMVVVSVQARKGME